MPGKKIKIVTLFLLCSTTMLLAAQDTILLADNSKIGCKVTRVGPKFIEYINPKLDAAVYYTVHRNIVQYIFYNSGQVDTFNPVAPRIIRKVKSSDSTNTTASQTNNYELGRHDALKLFSSPGAIFANGLSGVLLTYGLVTPIVFSWSKVNPNNISTPEYVKSTNAEYKRGFEKGATQKMHRQAWKSYGIGAATSAVLLISAVFYFGAY